MSEEKKQVTKKPQQQSKKPKADPKAAAPVVKKPKAPAQPAPPPRLRDKYMQQVCPKVKEEFKIDNPMALPRVSKVMVTVGMGKSLEGTKLNPKAKEQVLKDLTSITG
ncbi:MAG: hypothetical protein HC898_11235, partial [Phycisphaerales bacterium]|nr:hypothetical protein [Phycisphaerales bacterium]